MVDAGIAAERAVEFAGVNFGVGPALSGRPVEPRYELGLKVF